MRFYFQNMTRPKRVAKHLHAIFPLRQLAVTQDWTAKLYGYRNWHELTSITEKGGNPPSKLDEDIPLNERSDRNLKQVEMLCDITGISIVESLTFGLNLTSNKPPLLPTKAPNTPSGQGNLYTVLRYDTLGEEIDEADHIATDELSAFSSIPAEFGTEQQVIQKLAAAMKRNRALSSDFVLNSCELLAGARTGFRWQPIYEGQEQIGVTQVATSRIYVFDNATLRPRGFVVYELSAAAHRDDDDYNRFDMHIIEAWASPRDDDAWFGIADMCAGKFSYHFTKLCMSYLSPEPEQPMQLALSMTTESDLLMKKAFLSDVAEIAADQMEIDVEAINVDYL